MDPVNNKVKSKYWNALSETIETIKPDDLYYGIQHFTIDGQVSQGMRETFYSKQISPIPRIKFLEKYGPCMMGISDDILKEVGDSMVRKSPSNKLMIYSMSLLRRFIRSSRDEKKLLLINKLGFDELGLRITNGTSTTKQFVYKYSTHPTQLEIYLETDEIGQVKEINIFNNSNMEELRIPLNLDGLVYTFIQVISDLYKVDFDKFDPSKMDKKYTELNAKIIDFESSFPEFDNLDLDMMMAMKHLQHTQAASLS